LRAGDRLQDTREFFKANPNDFTLDVTDTHLGSNPNNFNLTERISAGYVANNSQFGRVRLQQACPSISI